MFNFLSRLFSKAAAPVIQNPSILICGIGDATYFEQDKSIYQPYQNITEFKAASLHELEVFINGRTFDIVHLFIHFDESGKVGDQAGISLLQILTKADTKLLMLATPNSVDSYIEAFPSEQRSGIDNMHIVLTIDRVGDNFTNSFKAMFKLMAQGKSMPMAWVTLAPQHDGPWMEKMAECLFEANRGGLLFLP